MAVISPQSSPPPSPACRPSLLACHHITTKTSAHCRCNNLVTAPTMAATATTTSTVATPATTSQPSLPQLPPRAHRHHCTHCPLAPCITWPHLQHYPSYTSTSSMYLFKCQIYYFLCTNVTNLM